MANDNYKGMSEYYKPQYDSDEDLDEATKKKIAEQENHFDTYGAEETRKAGWEKADLYPKLKRLVKGGWYGDKRKPQD